MSTTKKPSQQPPVQGEQKPTPPLQQPPVQGEQEQTPPNPPEELPSKAGTSGSDTTQAPGPDAENKTDQLRDPYMPPPAAQMGAESGAGSFDQEKHNEYLKVLADGRALVNAFRTRMMALHVFLKEDLMPSREISLAITDCQRTIHHTGLTLKNMGSENPYPESTNSESPKIEPIYEDADMDQFKKDLYEFKALETQTARVKALRGYIDEVMQSSFPDNFMGILSYEAAFHLSRSLQWLTEVKMWLGWELGRIRDLNDLKEFKNPLNIPLQ